jgi:hypothetical protein
MTKNPSNSRFLSPPFNALSLLLLGAALGAGCASTPERATEAAPIEPVVARAAWLINLRENLTQDLCTESEVFRSCYQVAENDCHARATQAATTCEYQLWNSIPEVLNNEQGQRLGAEIGRCAGDGMVQTFNATYAYSDTPQCQKLLSEL